ncbi:MAG: hypothetical protein KDK29_04540 [Sedimentitalea sp.]|nr:hypothetical protein [Sedimentitalea sp.]
MSDIHGAIWWNELMTRQADQALVFYKRLFGWQFKSQPNAEGAMYHVAFLGDAPVAGILDMEGIARLDDKAPGWMLYVAVDDADAAVDSTLAQGGALLHGPFDVPDVGRLAVLREPSGAMLGVMTPAGGS